MSKIVSLKDITKLKKNILEKLEEISVSEDFEELLYYISKILLDENFKKNYKKIKKTLKLITKNIDDVYLLYFKEYNKIRIFDNKENKFLIEVFYDLIDKLNENDKIKEADEINKNLSKLELGYKRYFNIRKNIKIDFFMPELKKFKIMEKENIYFFEYLDKVLEGKNEKIREKEFKKISKIINHFPEKIYSSKEKNILDYEESLFFKENLEIKKVDKFFIENQNSIYSIYKTIKLIKFIESKI